MAEGGWWAWDVSALVYARTYGPIAHRLDDVVLELAGDALRGGVAVDVGCGPGVVVRKLADRGARTVLAVDVSDGMLAQVPVRPEVVPVREAVAPGSLARLRQAHAPDGFGLVLFKRSLYQPAPEALRILADAWENLAPGGLLAVVHPEGDAARYAFGAPRRLRRYTPYHLFNRTISRLGARLGAEQYTTPTRAELLRMVASAAPGGEVRAVPFEEACFNVVVARRPADGAAARAA